MQRIMRNSGNGFDVDELYCTTSAVRYSLSSNQMDIIEFHKDPTAENLKLVLFRLYHPLLDCRNEFRMKRIRCSEDGLKVPSQNSHR